MPALVVVGAQWGDEGKGKITDCLADKADIVVRFQGGDNAGHTVVTGGQEYRLYLLPSGILRSDTLNLLGNGMAIDIAVLAEEIEGLRSRGHAVDNLLISHAAHLVMPYHRALDEAEEERLGVDKIGTTHRGIGPAYIDKYARTGIRAADLLDPDGFSEKIRKNTAVKNEILEKIYGRPGFDAEVLIGQYAEHREILSKHVVDGSLLLSNALKDGKNVLFEGAQGAMLEIDQGTYPYVTSSYTTAGGACIGAGVAPNSIDSVIGVVKAFTSRVGNGPFPTELMDSDGDYIRQRGHEYGTRTGRPRRIGWLDAVPLRTAARVNGFKAVALTRIDTLAGLDTVKICTAYSLDGEVTEVMPISSADVGRCEAVLREFEGWSAESVENVNTFEALPESAREYINAVEELIDCEVALIGVGQDRDATIMKSRIDFE